MTAPTETEFVSLLADLDREAFARFLADLWTARGHPAAIEDGRVVVEGGPTLRPHAPRHYLPARASLRRVDPDSEEVVATTDPDVAALLRERGVRTVGPTTLHRALLYDLDRATADRIGREHLGRPFDAEPSPGVGERLRATTDRVAPSALTVAVVAVALAVVAGGVLLASGAASDPTERVTSTPEPETTEGDEEPVGWVENDEVDGVGAYEVAPGVTTEGVTDVTALSRAHAAAVRNESYEWVVVYRHGVGGTNPVIGGGPGERSRQVARVENGTEALVRVTGDDVQNRSAELGATRDTYADGTARYVRRHHANGTTTVRRTPLNATNGPSGLATQAADLLSWGLDARRTDVIETERRGNVTHYRLVGRDIESFTIDDYWLDAWFTPAGLVTDMDVAYTTYGERGVTYVEFSYRRVGTTAVERPAWVPADSDRGTGTENGTSAGTENGTSAGTENETPTATPNGLSTPTGAAAGGG